jgi:hypothetical protein
VGGGVGLAVGLLVGLGVGLAVGLLVGFEVGGGMVSETVVVPQLRKVKRSIMTVSDNWVSQSKGLN